MKKSFALVSATLLTLFVMTSCGGGTSSADPHSALKELTAELVDSSKQYNIDDVIRKSDFNVTATYLDDTKFNPTYVSTPDLASPYRFTDEDLKNGKDFIFTYLNKTASVHINLKKQYYIDWNTHPVDGQGNNLYYYALKCNKIVFGDLTTSIPEGCTVFKCEEGAPEDEWNLRDGIKAYYKEETELGSNNGELYVICKEKMYFEDDDEKGYTTGIFENLENLETLDLKNADFSKVQIMKNMFFQCKNLILLDLSNFATTCATNMNGMFYHCDSLASLDLSNFDSSNVTDTHCMFAYCRNLETLNIKNFDTSKVKDMQWMFRDCQKLTSLDLSNFDTAKVENMEEMFYGCILLTSLDLSSFDVGNVTNMDYMFGICYQLSTLSFGDKFITSKVTDMSGMFDGCKKLSELNLTSFDTSNVTKTTYMFASCNELSKIIVTEGQFVTEQVSDDENMFSDCSTKLVGEQGTRWSEDKVTDKTYAHIDGGVSNPGYFWSL